MSVTLLTPFSMVTRRGAPKGAGDALTGRWATVGSDGRLAAPGSQRLGLYLILEGNLIHTGIHTDFGLIGVGFASTKSVELPSVAAAGACALAYGVYRYQVGPQGFDPAASYAVGDKVRSDAFGRIVPIGTLATDDTGEDDAIATVEAIVVNTSLTLRTNGK